MKGGWSQSMICIMILALSLGARLNDGGVIWRVAAEMLEAPSVEVPKEAEEDAVVVISGGTGGC